MTLLAAFWAAQEFGMIDVQCTTDRECLAQCMRQGQAFEQCDGYPHR
jgi:hypothetical protein